MRSRLTLDFKEVKIFKKDGCGSDIYLEKAKWRRELEELLNDTVVSLKSGFE